MDLGVAFSFLFDLPLLTAFLTVFLLFLGRRRKLSSRLTYILFAQSFDKV